MLARGPDRSALMPSRWRNNGRQPTGSQRTLTSARAHLSSAVPRLWPHSRHPESRGLQQPLYYTCTFCGSGSRTGHSRTACLCSTASGASARKTRRLRGTRWRGLESPGQAWGWLLAGATAGAEHACPSGFHVTRASSLNGNLGSSDSCTAVCPRQDIPGAVCTLHHSICKTLLGSQIASLLPHSVGQGDHRGLPRTKERGHRPSHSTGAEAEKVCTC